MNRRVLPLGGLLLLATGCFTEDTSNLLVSPSPFGPTPRPVTPTRVAHAPATEEVAKRVLAVGAKVVAANPQMALRPVFETAGLPQPEIFHQVSAPASRTRRSSSPRAWCASARPTPSWPPSWRWSWASSCPSARPWCRPARACPTAACRRRGRWHRLARDLWPVRWHALRRAGQARQAARSAKRPAATPAGGRKCWRERISRAPATRPPTSTT